MEGDASLKTSKRSKPKNFLLCEIILMLIATHYFAVAMSISSEMVLLHLIITVCIAFARQILALFRQIAIRF